MTPEEKAAEAARAALIVTEPERIKCKQCGKWHSNLIMCAATPDIMFRACRCVTIRLGQGIAIVPCAEYETKMLKMLKILE